VQLRRSITLCLIGAITAGAALSAQDFRGRWGRRATFKPSQAPNPGFIFCRIAYNSVRYEPLGQGWVTDYPDSDRNFMLRFGELTTAAISKWDDGEAFHAVVSLTDDEIFACPFVFMSDVGTLGLGAEEVRVLREYLLKGGFLWVDDYWGERAWRHWEREIQRVLPSHEIVDVPLSHVMVQTLYTVPEIPQVPSIQFWRRSGRRGTSERGPDSVEPHLRAIYDEHGRAMVVMTHNTDIADGWEREAEDDDFFYRFSPAAYGVGINLVLYALAY
jgi:hypothetical protein